jgi:transcription antitermination factor NusG
MNGFISGWYLLYTRPKQEKKVAIQLEEKEVDYFLPTIKITRQWHDRKKVIDTPLFPSYVFVNIKTAYEFNNGLSIDGVSCYVRFGKQLARVGQIVIDQIKLVIKRGKNILVSEESFLPGKQLIIRQGALSGLSCEVVKYGGGERILVRVDLLQRNILLMIPSDNVAEAPKF